VAALELEAVAGEAGADEAEEGEARPEDVAVVVGRPDLEVALVHDHRDGEALAPAEEVVLRDGHLQVDDLEALHVVASVEAERPDVAHDDEGVDRGGGGGARAAGLGVGLEGEDHDDVVEDGVTDVTQGLVDERLVPGLAGGEEELALDGPGAGRGVEEVEEAEEAAVVAREDVARRDDDAADGAALGVAGHAEVLLGEDGIDLETLEPAETVVVVHGRRLRGDGGGGGEAHDEE
jgi:hypothetical protein